MLLMLIYYMESKPGDQYLNLRGNLVSLE